LFEDAHGLETLGESNRRALASVFQQNRPVQHRCDGSGVAERRAEAQSGGARGFDFEREFYRRIETVNKLAGILASALFAGGRPKLDAVDV